MGTPVTISGTGFDPTPSQNRVTFNGVAAEVTSATPTQLVTHVPTGVTSGPIGVTTPGGSATSSTAFSATAPSGAPRITGFAPSIAKVGTPLTISGSNFAPRAVRNQVTVNVTGATVQSATPTAIDTTVPPNTGSDRMAVTTSAGTGQSAADLLHPVYIGHPFP